MPTVTIDDQGRLVLPKAMRERLGLPAGKPSALHVWETDDGVMREPAPRPAEVSRADDGMPLLTITTGEIIDNDDVLAAIRRDRNMR